MQVRFTCPACKQSHVLDMPETTVHMTCSRTATPMQLILGLGGEVKARIVGGAPAGTESEEQEEEA